MSIFKWIFTTIFALQTVLASNPPTPSLEQSRPSNEQTVGITSLVAEPTSTTKLPLTLLADEIQKFEGYYPGSRAYKNNNPGNLRYTGNEGAIGKDDKNFAIFATYSQGYAALMRLLQSALDDTSSIYRSDMTLLEFFNRYAPPFENETTVYVLRVARNLGINPNLNLSQLFQG